MVRIISISNMVAARHAGLRQLPCFSSPSTPPQFLLEWSHRPLSCFLGHYVVLFGKIVTWANLLPRFTRRYRVDLPMESICSPHISEKPFILIRRIDLDQSPRSEMCPPQVLRPLVLNVHQPRSSAPATFAALLQGDQHSVIRFRRTSRKCRKRMPRSHVAPFEQGALAPCAA